MYLNVFKHTYMRKHGAI